MERLRGSRERKDPRSKALAVIYARTFRQRNRKAGRCGCGRARDRRLKNGRLGKTCSACCPLIIEKPPAEQQATRRLWTKLTTEHDIATLTEWNEFCITYDMPMEAVLETAMELLLAVTAKEEKARQDEELIERLALEQSA